MLRGSPLPSPPLAAGKPFPGDPTLPVYFHTGMGALRPREGKGHQELAELGRAMASWLLGRHCQSVLSSGQRRDWAATHMDPTPAPWSPEPLGKKKQTEGSRDLQISLDEAFPFSVEHLEGMENGLLWVRA